MKKATQAIWAVIFGIIALVIFQNQEIFLAKQSFRIDLGVTKEYLTPDLPIAALVLIFFFFGIVIASVFNVATQLKAKHTIKRLNTVVASHDKEVSDLRSKIDSIKGNVPQPENQIEPKVTESG